MNDDDFYCSKLVYLAWKRRGYNIAYSALPFMFKLLIHIMNDGDVYIVGRAPWRKK